MVISLYTAYAFMPIEEFSSGDIFVVQAFITDLNWQFTMLFWAVFMLFETSISIAVSTYGDPTYYGGHTLECNT